MAQRIQLRNDTTVAWEASNPILAQGEVGVDTTLNKFKIGDGTSTWTELEFSSSGDIAEFVFAYDPGEEESTMTINNHDMIIRTTRDGSQDADIDIDSADDVWITANDEIEIDAGDTIDIRSNTDYVRIVSDRLNSNNEWTFETDGGLRFPDDTVQTTAYTGGEAGDLVVPTSIKDSEGDDLITFERTNTGTARIATPQDDLSLRSARDITLIAGDDGPGNVYIGWGDATITPNANNRVATIADIQEFTTGDITFDGVQIIGAGTASGDGLGYGTIELVPDADINTDQYLVVDPTSPGHIHIRAGGAQDYSNAELIVGGERAHVKVVDLGGYVEIQSKKEDYNWTYPNIDPAGGVVYIIDSEVAEPDLDDFMIVDGVKYVITSVNRNQEFGVTSYETTPSFTFAYNQNYTFTRDNGNYTWTFGAVDDQPVLVLPSEQPIIINTSVPGDITLSAYNGVKLSFADTEGAGLEFPDNTVQTTAFAGGATGSFVSQDGKTITVTNGIITSIEVNP